MWLVKFISKLPFPVLYTIADLLYFLAYHVVKYRKKVVFTNLQKSFPEKSSAELRLIARKFYRNLADVSVEVLKSNSMSAEEIKRRVKPINIASVNKWQQEQISFIAMVPHLCNWEWIGLSCSLYLEHETDVIYQKLAHEKFDEFMFKLRSRFGAVPIEKKKVFRELLKRKNVLKNIGSVSDQTPSAADNRFWTTFLNQETAFFQGTEKIAKKLNYAICIVHMRRLKRGYYEMEFITLDEPPLEEQEHYYTAKFASWLEETIRKNPADWLWSHKRWKLKKPADVII